MGKEGSAYPNADHRGQCDSGTCRIWDYSLRGSDIIIQNKNGVFTPGAACPNSIDGNMTATWESKNYLQFAFEILGDLEGDDDGLCESNEACLYSPNAGAYQGDRNGDFYSRSCIFNDGVVTGVKMYSCPP